MDLKLSFGPAQIGFIRDWFISDGTGFGQFDETGRLTPGTEQVWQFIDSCKEWHDRLNAGDDCDAQEFEKYRDVYGSQDWIARGHDGTSFRINQPVFDESEITWAVDS